MSASLVCLAVAAAMAVAPVSPPPAVAPAPAPAPAEAAPPPQAAPAEVAAPPAAVETPAQPGPAEAAPAPTIALQPAPAPAATMQPAPAPAPTVPPPPPVGIPPAADGLVIAGAIGVAVGGASLLFVSLPSYWVRNTALRRAEREDALAFTSRRTRYDRARRADDVMEGAFWVGAPLLVTGTVLLVTGLVIRANARARSRMAAVPGGVIVRF